MTDSQTASPFLDCDGDHPESPEEHHEGCWVYVDSLPPLVGCGHASSTGIDTTEGPEKVWRCDACRVLLRFVTGGDGITRLVPIEAS